MEITPSLTNQDVIKEEPVKLFSPKNPTVPLETIFLSNIDQAVNFTVETVYFFEVHPNKASSTLHISQLVKTAVAEVLLVPYYFMAGRLNFNHDTNRLELLCNNSGVMFVTATSSLALKELGNISLPNSTFHHFIHRPGIYKSLAETALFTIQASPAQIKYPHKEYVKLANINSSLATSFTSQKQTSPSPLIFSEKYVHKLFSFTPGIVSSLKEKAMTKCSSFEAIVAHLWRARTKAVLFENTQPDDEFSTVLFAMDIRSRISPPLPNGFAGNAVITAFATAKVKDLFENPFSYSVEKVKEARERVTDDYIRSVIDWLEVYKGVPATCNIGNFYVSAWWKLPFGELDFGFGKPVHGGPVVSGNDEFVLLLSDGNDVGNGGAINVWMGRRNRDHRRWRATQPPAAPENERERERRLGL